MSPWLTKSEAADHMRVTTRTIDAWVAAGKIQKYNVGGMQSVRFARAELDALLTPQTE
jgi:excisionase family DNA binding protein